ncbi:GAF domain-containing protein [Deinococcus sp. QL22]|uniref:GAF domain-containing protein n=1 Tax=Deinococcus sp. QL22 TaxID=2939437 RepID=UPI002016B09F|nr:GAF domain-containing protein [Deinococcus sp. QL22]UQN09977.1 GAF domain-containing protein [Deinococcus sp. QL22]
MPASAKAFLPPSLITLSDALPTSLILLSRAGLILHANPPAACVLQHSAGALAGRFLWDVVAGLGSRQTLEPGPLTWLHPVTGERTEADVVALEDALALTWAASWIEADTGGSDKRAANSHTASPTQTASSPHTAALRQQALAEVASDLVAVIDSADVVRVVMQAGRQAVGAYGAVVYLLNAHRHTILLLGADGYGELLPDWMCFDLQRRLPLTDSARTGQPLFLDQQTYQSLYPDLPRQSITRSTAVLPLAAGQRILGVLGLSFDHDHAFPEDERAFLTTLTNQCAIALERAQAVEAVRRAAQRSELLSQISEQLMGTYTPQMVLEQLPSLVVPALADWCSVALDDGQGHLVLHAVAHRDAEVVARLRNLRQQAPLVIEDAELVAQVFRTGEALLMPVVQDVSALIPEQATDAAGAELAQVATIRSMMLVPLNVRGRTAGMLSLMSGTPGYFGPEDLKFAQEFARRAALALDNAGLLKSSQASEARYRALTEATDQYVWTNSAEGEMLGEQPGWAALTGQTPEEYRGYGWSARLHEGDREHAVAAWHEALRLRSKYEVEQRVQVKDGSYRHFLVRAVPLLGDQGEIREWVGLHSDVTELRQAETQLRAWNEDLERRVAQSTEKLRAANAELDAFNHSVSHDLRAPVRHVLGFAGLLRRGAEEKLGAREQRLLAQVETSAQHMNTLIDELLAFARLSREPLRTTAVNLSVLIGEIQTVLEPEVGTRQIEWQIGALPVVSGDPQLLKFALINLLSNAIKYTSTRPIAHIEIGGEQRGEEMVIWVRDDGVGFDPKYAAKLFGVFQRLHSQQEFEGIGIGLANVGRIVTRHGGRVWAEGAVGVGATFFVGLPLHS